MSTSRRRKRGALTGVVALGVAACTGVGILATTSNSASAAALIVKPDTPDGETVIKDLVAKCNTPSPERKCTWSDVKVESRAAKGEIVGKDGKPQKFVNCGNGLARPSVTWSRTTGYTVTVGAKVGFKATVDELFVGFEANADFSISGAWKDDVTFSDTTSFDVPVGETGWITHAEKQVVGTGTLTVVAGENTFVIPDVEIVAPHGQDQGSTLTHTRKHTEADKAECASAPAPTAVDIQEVEVEGDGRIVIAPGDDLPTP